jgi:hypothetical protein
MLAALTGSPLRGAAEKRRRELPAPSGASLPCAALPAGHAALPRALAEVEGQVLDVVKWSLSSPATPSPGGSLCVSTRLLKAWAIAGVGGGGGNVRVTLQADDAKKVLVKHAARGCLVTDLAVAAGGRGAAPAGSGAETESEVLASADSAGVVSVTLVSVLAFDGSLVATPLLEVETDCGDGGSEAAPTLLRWHPSELGALFIARSLEPRDLRPGRVSLSCGLGCLSASVISLLLDFLDLFFKLSDLRFEDAFVSPQLRQVTPIRTCIGKVSPLRRRTIVTAAKPLHLQLG